MHLIIVTVQRTSLIYLRAYDLIGPFSIVLFLYNLYVCDDFCVFPECNDMQLILNVGGPDRLSRLQMAETVAAVRGYKSSLLKPISASLVSLPKKLNPESKVPHVGVTFFLLLPMSYNVVSYFLSFHIIVCTSG